MTEHDFDLPEISDLDNITALIEEMKDGLLHADDSFNDEYRRIRAILRSHPLLKANLPDYLRRCRDVGDYRAFMQTKFPDAAQRETYLRQTLMDVIESVENSQIAFESYEIVRHIGRGGFGQVFLAKHKLLQRECALKVFQPAFQEGGTHLSRFFQEAGMLYELDHPSIIKIRDVGLYRNRPFIVMDYFPSVSLNTALIQEGRMPPFKAVAMIESVCRAIQHAHNRRIVHRDLKPTNILLAAPQQCRVIDFGLGVYVENVLTSRLTRTGEAVAGDHFTARELLSDPRRVDPRSDIYSIGAVWYHALTNQYPSGSGVARSLDEVAELDRSHKEIILRCLADLDQRFATCGELLTAIAATRIEQEHSI